LSWGVSALVALAAAGAAAALSGWLRSVAQTESVWYRRRLHIPLALAAGLGAARLGSTWVQVLCFTVLGVAAALLFTIDLGEERLPDVILLPMYPVLFVSLALDAALGNAWPAFFRSLIAAAVLLVAFVLLSLMGPLYFGDVKLAGLLGGFLGWLGWSQVALGFFAGFALQAIAGIIILLTGRGNRKSELPFGPALIAGAAIGAGCGPMVFPGLG